MVVIEITAKCMGIIRWNYGQTRLILPGDKYVIKAREGEVYKIELDEADIFRKDREEMNNRQGKLNLEDYDNQTGNS